MTHLDDDSHVQHTWTLTRSADGDEICIDLWTDGETIQVHGGDGESYTPGPDAREQIEQQILPKYAALGYRVDSDYAVNDAHEPELPDDQPDECAECGRDTEYVPDHYDGYRTGPAWMCTGCNWGQWSVGT